MSSSAMISTDFTEGARLGSLEAGFDEVLHSYQIIVKNTQIKLQLTTLQLQSSPGRWLGGHNRRGL